MDTKKTVLATLPQNYQQKVDDILLKIQKYFWNNGTSSEEIFPRSDLYEHKDCSFDNPAKNFPTKQNNCRNDWKNVFGRRKNFLKTTLWELRMLFRQFYRKLLPEGRTVLFLVNLIEKNAQRSSFEKKKNLNWPP